MSSADKVGLAIKQVSRIERYASDEDAANTEVAPLETRDIDSGWVDYVTGEPITDPDRIARLEANAMAKSTFTAGQKVIVTDDEGNEAACVVDNPNLGSVMIVKDEHGLPRGVPTESVRAADEGDE
jgi:hypothetical protein